MSRTKIQSVAPGTPAHQAGVRPGETLLAINGHPIVDVLDYKYYAYDPELVLQLRSEAGERTVELSKDVGEDLGLTFATYLMDRARSCANKCVFCFVDQMPQGMRDTLYFKDDDARLSFLMGNYITLTNLSRRELQRICDLHISPINISVHATDPAVRRLLLGNQRRGGECLEIMEQFARAGIVMNCQIVACPGVNDGPALDRTLRELGALHPAVGSVAVVPVGVTRFREGLCRIDPYTPAQAAAVLDQVEAFAASFLKKHSTHLAWCSDEFYLLAGRPLPEKGYYEDMAQMENGVGMLRLLTSQAAMALENMELEEAPPPFAIATGVSAAPFLQKIVDMCREKCGNIIGNVYPVVNRFFGETITVSGLITGRDLIEQLKGKALGERLLIPDSMLRAGERIFLDDVTVEQVEEALGVPVTALTADSGFDLVDAILGLPVETPAYALPPEDDYYRYNP